jgi:hypothetical protein
MMGACVPMIVFGVCVVLTCSSKASASVLVNQGRSSKLSSQLPHSTKPHGINGSVQQNHSAWLYRLGLGWLHRKGYVWRFGQSLQSIFLLLNPRCLTFVTDRVYHSVLKNLKSFG